MSIPITEDTKLGKAITEASDVLTSIQTVIADDSSVTELEVTAELFRVVGLDEAAGRLDEIAQECRNLNIDIEDALLDLPELG